jgi:hypothetical protein
MHKTRESGRAGSLHSLRRRSVCVFVQIESRLCENDTIYYDSYEYENAPVTYNSGRRKRAYQYAAFVLWEGINHRRPDYKCVEKRCPGTIPTP